MLNISKQAIHQHAKRELRFQSKIESLIVEADILRTAHPGCGVEKMYYTLRPDWIGRDRFIELMIGQGYRIQKYKSRIRTTTPASHRYPNLIEGMILWDKNQLWQSDITYYRVGESFYYAVFIIDVYTRVVLGYCVSDSLQAQANLVALKMAIRNAGGMIKGLVHHSDRGSQYVSTDYVSLLADHGVHISMGLKGQENAYAERINGTIKNEYLIYREITTLAGLKRQTRQAVEHYNTKRPHNSLKGRASPKQFEKNILNLSCQKRPKVIVYAEGNPRIKEASSHLDSLPEKNLQAPVCPMVN
jgi:transposase InsO family protein